MKANPGGIVVPENVIGRDLLIERLWATLEAQSVVLVSERRMGKTSIVKKMCQESPNEVLSSFLDVEGLSSTLEFVERIARDVARYLHRIPKLKMKAREMWNKLGGIEIGGILKLPKNVASNWKDLLEEVFHYLPFENCRIAVFFWDEFPLMLQKIKKTAGNATVIDLLDSLRALRQTHSKLRMVLTGSIGLHHVVTELREGGYTNSPINDMRMIEVVPLETEAVESGTPPAEILALALLKGEDFSGNALGETAMAIARQTNGVPFYIHNLVAEMKTRPLAANPDTVEKVVDAIIRDPNDPLDMDHFRSRLGEYYGPKDDLARAVLNLLAEEEPLELYDIRQKLILTLSDFNAKSRKILEGSAEGLRAHLTLLQRDHYLHFDAAKGYAFRLGMIRRWWRFQMGVS